jgi:hypothetical protein
MSTTRRGPLPPRPPCSKPPSPPLRTAASAGTRRSPGAVLSTAARVVKKVTPPQKGSQQWARHYGTALVCVRYREDSRRATRYTTVELVVDVRQLPLQAHTLILVPIAPNDETTRRKAIELGAKWKRRENAWLMPLHAAIQLDLTNLSPDSAYSQPPGAR